MILYHDVPRSKGVENAIKRAKQMVELEWMPVRPYPDGASIHTPEGHKYLDIFTQPWQPQKGVGYSSVRLTEKYVGFNLSHETYLSAIANPRSRIYTTPQHGLGLRMFAYCGLVCSAFVSYVCDLPLRLPCSYWPHDPRVSLVNSDDLRNLMLCDIVLNPVMHIAIITDIERDVEGNVQYITVSESKLPRVISTRFTAEAFRGYWLGNGYQIYRYSGIDSAAYTPSPFVHLEGDPNLPVPAINKVIQPDLGNRANYMLSETVELDLLESGWEEVEITGAVDCVLPVEEDKAVFQPQAAGFYTARAKAGERYSDPVEFCVTDISVVLDRTVCGTSDTIGVTFSAAAPEDEPIGWIVQNLTWGYRGGGVFTEEEKRTGKFSIVHAGKPPVRAELEPGEYQVFVLVKNCNGIYKSEFINFTVQ